MNLQEKLLSYVAAFNREDEELYQNEIPNDKALSFLREEIPLFECPDPDIERSYYFRFWSYRKHLRKTKYGYAVTEFLPRVSWADPETNIIHAAVAHHVNEGRWLKNADRYLMSYLRHLLSHPALSHLYSAPMLDAILHLTQMRGLSVDRTLFAEMEAYYKEWEDTHRLANGMLYSIDNEDAMEKSVSGTTPAGVARPGIRPTLNSYMAADAAALASFAEALGDREKATYYRTRSEALRTAINDTLWRDGFYRACHADTLEALPAALAGFDSPMEEIGAIPFLYGIPPAERDEALLLFGDRAIFRAPHGITTCDMREPRYLEEHDHECLWNGYVWPYATSQTLGALLAAARRNAGDDRYKALFFELLSEYAANHKIEKDGKTLPWIDEVMHPESGDWHSRSYLEAHGWIRYGENHYERGKDYNHSAFCDLVLSALTGADLSADGVPQFSPVIPDSWNDYRIENLYLYGKRYTVTYDKDGTRYGRGTGFIVTTEEP